MGDLMLRTDAALTGATIAILMESDYVEPELHYYQRRFAEEGARIVFLTRLWGQEEITFHGHEFQLPFTVDGDLEAVDEEMLASFDAFIVPSGMVSDRLRYTEDVNALPPATRLLQQAFAKPDLLKGIICHGMWLVAPVPELIRGRRITCHNNLLGDVRNMGAIYTDQDVVVDRDLVTARSADHCHLFARMIIDLILAQRSGTHSWDATSKTFTPQQQTTPPARTKETSHPSAAPAPATQPPAAAAQDVETSTETTTAQAEPEPGLEPASSPRNDAVEVPFRPEFTFSDLVAGYVTWYDADKGLLEVRTSDGRTVPGRLTPTSYAEFLRNLGSPYLDATEHLGELLVPGRHVFLYGVFYPENAGYVMEAKRLVFLGRRVGEYEFEKADWWIHQLRELARFYRRAQFGEDGPINYDDYRTVIRLGGDKQKDQYVQETDTVSRLVYGMASAYMLTGEQEFLEVAEKGAEYLRRHMRFVDKDEDVVYWYHGIEVHDGTERKLFTSEFGDDYDAIPMYEQIYALAGLTQLFRVTGDPQIAADINGTLRLFEKFFRDHENGGYYSHIDPILLSAQHESLGPNRARKNWNSVGDHAPAYLINLWLATGEQRHAEMLERTFDLITERMPDPNSPFVQERFHADWTPDRTWSWQQDRAVVGHNLKIAWNLTRMNSIQPKSEYRELAEKIGRIMPELGSDQQRGGWYDVVEREISAGEQRHRFVWHDRKAWWQQEQAILAYLIMAGVSGDEEFDRQGREAASFYNAFFLDHDEGGVYFNVLADGNPYLVGTERLKGSHSMSMYHSAELCYLATTYEHLLLRGEPMTIWFRPQPEGFEDRILRVAPDALPEGRVRLDWVEVDGRPHAAFDAEGLTVKLPESQDSLTVRVHLSPSAPSASSAPSAPSAPSGAES